MGVLFGSLWEYTGVTLEAIQGYFGKTMKFTNGELLGHFRIPICHCEGILGSLGLLWGLIYGYFWLLQHHFWGTMEYFSEYLRVILGVP